MSFSFAFTDVWVRGDVITRLILLALFAMSVLSWVVMGLKVLEAWGHKQSALGSEAFWQTTSLTEGLALLARRPDNPFHTLAQAGHAATQHHQSVQSRLPDRLDLSDWVIRSLRNAIDHHITVLQKGLAVLASIGSTAPFVGLFGTVWGIYHALLSIGANGNANIDAVAGPIGETLIMTALGLAVAIPAVLGHNALVRSNKFIIARMNRFSHDLHAYYVTGSRVTHGGQNVL